MGKRAELALVEDGQRLRRNQVPKFLVREVATAFSGIARAHRARFADVHRRRERLGFREVGHAVPVQLAWQWSRTPHEFRTGTVNLAGGGKSSVKCRAGR
jgi:hypothetical protein